MTDTPDTPGRPLPEAALERIRQRLHAGIDRLEAATGGGRRRLWREALALEHALLSDLLTPEEEERVLSGMDSRRIRACQDIFCALETRIENSFASMALDGDEKVILREDSISEVYLCRYEELARKEIALSAMTEKDRVLFIGSGPLPITAVEYVRQTGCTADCADFVEEAVRTSRSVIDRLGLAGKIRCLKARGETVPASAYSVILVGVLARPKNEIFANIEATGARDCRIIARTTYGLRRLIYQAVEFDPTTLPGFARGGTNVARGDQVISAELYVKRG